MGRTGEAPHPPPATINRVSGHATVHGHVFQAQHITVTVVGTRPAPEPTAPTAPTVPPASPPHPPGADDAPRPPARKAPARSRKEPGRKPPARVWGPVPIGSPPGKDRSEPAPVHQPLILDDALVVRTGTQLHLLDSRDGHRRPLVTTGTGSGPLLGAGHLCFQGLNREINTVELRTGRRHRWSPRLSLHEGRTSVSGGTVLTVGPDGLVVAMDLRRRDRLWTMTEMDCHIVSAPRTTAGHVVALGARASGTGRVPDRVAGLHEEDGSGHWLYPTDAPLSELWSVSAGTVHVIETAPPRLRLHAIDAATGSERWISAWFEGAPADLTVAGGTVFLRTQDRHLHAVAAEDGRTRWSAPDITHPPTVAEGRVLLVENATTLAAVEPATGHDMWPRRPKKGTLLVAPFVTAGAVHTIGHTGLTTRNAATGRALGPPYPMSLSPDGDGVPALVGGVLCFTNARREVEAVSLG
ncbi:PQQ-binding-like beta-propeller repeat protein [Kitasatospora sp. NPDC059327]|uniref:outer membrane protein assembly factor BamB family protein n=1 Tax=Kitasatospora sp. NPDC059327 TaxID=3346803 RepID=UPI0036776CD9